MSSSKRVLIVDDEPGIGPLVSMCLDPLGIEVLLADGLEEALRISGVNRIGLVLLDLALGSEDGLEILPRLRSDPNLQGVPVIAFSAHDSRKVEALEQGAESFIGRPFTSAVLQETVQRYLVA